MNTSKYDSNARKKIKRIQRHPLIENILKERRAERDKLEQLLTKRNERIAVLEKFLKERGYETTMPK